MAEGKLVNGNANKIAMSRALGAAFLHHQVEQLEKTVSSPGPTSGNWRDRRAPTNVSPASGRRGPNSPATKATQRRKAGDTSPAVVTKERAAVKDKDFDRNVASSPTARRRSEEGDRKPKDADIIVVDGSVLIHALYQVKKWCREGREEVIIVPLEALNTLDLLKKGTSGLAQKARAASRILEAQVGTNPRIRVQRDDAFVLWDQIKFDASAANPNSCPEWVRRIICCTQWESEHPEEEIKSTDRNGAVGGKPHSVVLAVLSSFLSSSPPWGSVALSTESPVPLPAPNISHATRHEPRATGSLVSTWASKAGISILDIEPAQPDRGGEDDDRVKRGKIRRPSAGEHTAKSSLVERPPAVKTMMDMVSQPTKVIRVLARGEKLDP